MPFKIGDVVSVKGVKFRMTVERVHADNRYDLVGFDEKNKLRQMPRTPFAHIKAAPISGLELAASLADEIRAISEGIRKLRAGPLTEDAIVLLIQHAVPRNKRNGAIIPQKTVKQVLDAMGNLEAVYVKKGKA